jgi:DNA invertase Pin-like site-specific DNA recombinase
VEIAPNDAVLAPRSLDVITPGQNYPVFAGVQLRGDVYKGRPATISPDAVRDLRQQGFGATQIAKRLKIGRASVYRLLAA